LRLRLEYFILCNTDIPELSDISPGRSFCCEEQRQSEKRDKEPPALLGKGKSMSEEQFREWVRRQSRLPLAVKGHTFLMKDGNIIGVDGGKFVYEEALELVRLLSSKNPLAQINANFMIAERNGTLRLVVLGLIAAIVVVVILLVRR
jgi:hypothetical protein